MDLIVAGLKSKDFFRSDMDIPETLKTRMDLIWITNRVTVIPH